MKKRKIISVCAYVTIIYIVTLIIFHANYSYVDYFIDEGEILMLITLVYLITVCFAIFFLVGHKERIPKENLSDVAIHSALETATVELPKVTSDKSDEECDVDGQRRYEGTGVIGLTRYYHFCIIVAFISLVVALFCIGLYPVGGMVFAMIFVYLIVGCVCCVASMPFVKALITVVKAAKLYIDINQNNQIHLKQ